MARSVASNGAETRVRLMDAAVDAFAEKGFHGTTTREICTAAGLSPAAIYVHFSSKEELLYQVSKAGHESTLDVVSASQQGLDDPAEQLTAWVDAFVQHHAKERTKARIVNYELRSLSAEHWAEVVKLRSALDRQLVDIISRGVNEGVFATADVRMAASTLSSLGIDVARWYRPEGHWSPSELGSYYARLALRVVECRDPALTA